MQYNFLHRREERRSANPPPRSEVVRVGFVSFQMLAGTQSWVDCPNVLQMMNARCRSQYPISLVQCAERDTIPGVPWDEAGRCVTLALPRSVGRAGAPFRIRGLRLECHQRNYRKSKTPLSASQYPSWTGCGRLWLDNRRIRTRSCPPSDEARLSRATEKKGCCPKCYIPQGRNLVYLGGIYCGDAPTYHG